MAFVLALTASGTVAAAGTAFGDLAGYGWAAPGIAALQGQGALNGASPGTFDPGGLLTRAQVAAVLGRLLGWTPQAAGAGLPFTDAAAIPAYARPYVAEAAAKGILQGLPDGAFAPQGDLTWPQLAAVAARALAYPPVAASQVAGILSHLPQGAGTPAWAQQAVAQDAQAGDFAGVLADLYQPAGDVTRAELAAFLAQAQQGAGSAVGGGSIVSGQLTAVGGQQATVQTSAGTQRVAISPGAAIYSGTAPGSSADLQPGATITLGAANGTAAAVDITASPTLTRPAGLTDGLRGTLVWATATQVGVAPPGMATVYVPLSSDVAVTLPGGQSGTLGDLASGQAVALTLNGAGQAVAISAAAGDSTTSLTGMVASLAGTLLALDVAGTDETFSLPPALAANGAVAPGAEVTLTLSLPGGQVAGLTVDSPAPPATVAGTVASIAGDALVLDVSGTDQPYTLSGATTVNGVAGDLGAIAAGQTATLTVSGGQVTTITTTTATTVTGQVVAVSGDSVVVDVAGVDQSYTLTSTAAVDGVLAAGESVTLSLAGSQITSAQIGGTTSTTSATGVVESLAGNNLILEIGDTAEIFTVTPATAVGGVYGDLAALVPGSTVTLSLSDGNVTAVQVQPATGTTVTGQVLSLAGNTLDLEVSGTGQVYTVTPTTTVDGRLGNLGAVFIGETVTVTASGTAVSSIETSAAGSVTGEVVSVSPGALVVDVAGTYESFALTASTTVDGALDNTAALAAGRTVTVYAAAGAATAIQITAASGGSGATGLVDSVAGGSLVVDVAGVSQAYTLSASTTVDGVANNAGALAAGQTVSLSAVGGQVTTVEILSGTGSATLSGAVASVAGQVVVVDVNGADDTFTLTTATTVDGVANDAAAIADGDTVTLTLSGGQVTAVQIG